MLKLFSVGDNWNCPYCGHAQVIAKERHDVDRCALHNQNWIEGFGAYIVDSLVCSNSECRRISLNFILFRRTDYSSTHTYKLLDVFKEWRLLPASFAKPQPDYIPQVIRDDYEEACAIRDLSPKASATLTRRCIQGIIRNFCGIKLKDNRLVKEIEELRRLVDSGQAPRGVQIDTVDAIDKVRKIGNIGAHMEADINVIVDVDPNEAQILINLTELLFDEWYVENKKRTDRIEQVGLVAAKKEKAKKPDTDSTSESKQ